MMLMICFLLLFFISKSVLAAMSLLTNGASTIPSSNLHVSRFPLSYSESDLRNLFSPFGEIESCVIIRDIFSGASKGIGFVNYYEPDCASKALSALDGLQLQPAGCSTTPESACLVTLRVQIGQEFRQGKPTSRVFVRNIPSSLSEGVLHKHFSQFGEIKWLSLHHDGAVNSDVSSVVSDHLSSQRSAKDKHNRGLPRIFPLDATATPQVGKPQRCVAFITYSSKDAANSAVAAMHNTLPFAECGDIPILAKLIMDSRSKRKGRKGKAESKESKTDCDELNAPVNVLRPEIVSPMLRSIATIQSDSSSISAMNIPMTPLSPAVAIPNGQLVQVTGHWVQTTNFEQTQAHPQADAQGRYPSDVRFSASQFFHRHPSCSQNIVVNPYQSQQAFHQAMPVPQQLAPAFQPTAPFQLPVLPPQYGGAYMFAGSVPSSHAMHSFAESPCLVPSAHYTFQPPSPMLLGSYSNFQPYQ